MNRWTSLDIEHRLSDQCSVVMTIRLTSNLAIARDSISIAWQEIDFSNVVCPLRIVKLWKCSDIHILFLRISYP